MTTSSPDGKGVVIGLDLGGTFTKTIVLSRSRTEIAYSRELTPKFDSNEQMIEYINQIICSQHIKGDLLGVGIGLPGIIGSGGVLSSTVLFPNVSNVPIVSALHRQFKIPIVVENDSNLAAIGEFAVSEAESKSLVVVITLGTGVGGGIILNGNLFAGSTGHSAELGHMKLEKDGPMCFCGMKGCLNILASATALLNIYQNTTSLTSSADDIMQICNLILMGDEKALSALTQLRSYLSLAIANIITILNPDLVILSGGLANLGLILLNGVRKTVRENVLPDLWNDDLIQLGLLKDKAGAMGAAELVVRKLDTSLSTI